MKSLRARQIELERAAQQARFRQMPENQIGIRDSGFRSTPIADRPGIGSGAFRADAQRAGAIEPRERAASGPYGMNVEHGHGHRHSRNKTFGRRSQRISAFAVQQRNVRRRAAHIERNQAAKA